jgi:hypothetical protein
MVAYILFLREKLICRIFRTDFFLVARQIQKKYNKIKQKMKGCGVMGRRKMKADVGELLEKYADKSDAEIAQLEGVHRSTVSRWRSKKHQEELLVKRGTVGRKSVTIDDIIKSNLYINVFGGYWEKRNLGLAIKNILRSLDDNDVERGKNESGISECYRINKEYKFEILYSLDDPVRSYNEEVRELLAAFALIHSGSFCVNTEQYVVEKLALACPAIYIMEGSDVDADATRIDEKQERFKSRIASSLKRYMDFGTAFSIFQTLVSTKLENQRAKYYTEWERKTLYGILDRWLNEYYEKVKLTVSKIPLLRYQDKLWYFYQKSQEKKWIMADEEKKKIMEGDYWKSNYCNRLEMELIKQNSLELPKDYKKIADMSRNRAQWIATIESWFLKFREVFDFEELEPMDRYFAKYFVMENLCRIFYQYFLFESILRDCRFKELITYTTDKDEIACMIKRGEGPYQKMQLCNIYNGMEEFCVNYGYPELIHLMKHEREVE